MRFIRRCCPKCNVRYSDSWPVTSFLRGNLTCPACGHIVSLSLAARSFTIGGAVWATTLIYGLLQVGVLPAFFVGVALLWMAFVLQISRQIPRVASD